MLLYKLLEESRPLTGRDTALTVLGTFALSVGISLAIVVSLLIY